MFLKKLVLALFIVNLGYFSYTQGWLQQLVGGDASQREPDRMAKQINAEAISVAPVQAPSAIATTAARTLETCAEQQDQWMIYMGPYPNKIIADRKKVELMRIKIKSTEVSKAALPLGLSLGQFETEALAQAASVRLKKQGVNTATIILWKAKSSTAACP